MKENDKFYKLNKSSKNISDARVLEWSNRQPLSGCSLCLRRFEPCPSHFFIILKFGIILIDEKYNPNLTKEIDEEKKFIDNFNCSFIYY